jgi:hypothetical protein
MDHAMTMGRTAAEHETEGDDTELVSLVEAMQTPSSHGRMSSLPASGGCWERRLHYITSSLQRVFRPQRLAYIPPSS